MQSSSDAFSSLLSDPRALSTIAEIMSNLQKPPPSSTPSPQPPPSDQGEAPPQPPSEESLGRTSEQTSAPPPPPPPPRSTPDLSSILGAALSNPELLSALPSVMSMLSGMGVGAPTQTPRIGALGARESTPVFDRRCALLNALKPYLPEDKRATVDTVVRVIEIMSLIK